MFPIQQFIEVISKLTALFSKPSVAYLHSTFKQSTFGVFIAQWNTVLPSGSHSCIFAPYLLIESQNTIATAITHNCSLYFNKILMISDLAWKVAHRRAVCLELSTAFTSASIFNSTYKSIYIYIPNNTKSVVIL